MSARSKECSNCSSSSATQPQEPAYRLQTAVSSSSGIRSERRSLDSQMTDRPPPSWYPYGNPPRADHPSSGFSSPMHPDLRRDSLPGNMDSLSPISSRSSRSVHFEDEVHPRDSLSMSSGRPAPSTGPRPQRKPSNRDEFDGPHQLLHPPSPRTLASKEINFPKLPISFSLDEQRDILGRLAEVLSKCAYDFVAKFQFPIPVEPDKRLVITSQDREWSEWVYLLKRLATKRRIPARALYDNQIKRLVTVLENSLEPPEGSATEPRLLKDDRTVLQYISAGTQVAKILKDGDAMVKIDKLYVQTAKYIQDRQWTGLPI